MASSLGTPLPRWYIVHLANLYSIANRFAALFPDRKFTPDGHLVGSIGEVIAAYMFELELLPAGAPDHDGEAGDGRKIQIKFTQGNRSVGIRAEPELLLVLRLTPDRCVEVVYNGLGRAPWSEPGKVQSNGQKSISLKRLRELDAKVLAPERLRRAVPCLSLAK